MKKVVTNNNSLCRSVQHDSKRKNESAVAQLQSAPCLWTTPSTIAIGIIDMGKFLSSNGYF